MPQYMVLAPFPLFGGSAGDIVELEEERANELDQKCRMELGVQGLKPMHMSHVLMTTNGPVTVESIDAARKKVETNLRIIHNKHQAAAIEQAQSHLPRAGEVFLLPDTANAIGVEAKQESMGSDTATQLRLPRQIVEMQARRAGQIDRPLPGLKPRRPARPLIVLLQWPPRPPRTRLPPRCRPKQPRLPWVSSRRNLRSFR